MAIRKAKPIHCPKCNKKVAMYDGRRTTTQLAKCKKCDRLVVYDVDTDTTKTAKIPERGCSSGMIKY